MAASSVLFWDHVVDGTGSIVFRLIYNSFRAAYEPALPLLTAAITLRSTRLDAYRKLAEAICAGDALSKRRKPATIDRNSQHAPMLAALDKIERQAMSTHLVATSFAARSSRGPKRSAGSIGCVS